MLKKNMRKGGRVCTYSGVNYPYVEVCGTIMDLTAGGGKKKG